MEKSHKISMLGTVLIGLFYTMTLHGQRKRDRVHVVYSRRAERAKNFCGGVENTETHHRSHAGDQRSGDGLRRDWLAQLAA